ncbi:hypothetical protein J3B02_000514 [Coemansia erecta]|uniref:Ribosome biogenesis protein SLX9 n=1 Tax=Coemansia asiatica TaxID=1052880 RepID=A0A9W7XGL3_9FUNG|nr:hypothetical protein LPJ64_005366 [Coemansia asiatica]KAJ2858115.1 hypothetical protein J3B02_000514 [Coemansia erecta]
MPRVTRTRQKTRTAPTDIVSAAVPLVDPSVEQSEPRQTKKVKRLEKHAKWMEKMNQVQQSKRLEQRQQGRETNKSALIRGMRTLDDTLREVRAEMAASHLLKLGNKAANKGQKGTGESKANNPKSRKARNKAAIVEEKRFTQVLAHPAFKANPLATIREHLSNTLAQSQHQQQQQHPE